jgi:hypothetical protein
MDDGGGVVTNGLGPKSTLKKSSPSDDTAGDDDAPIVKKKNSIWGSLLYCSFFKIPVYILFDSYNAKIESTWGKINMRSISLRQK